MGKESRRVVLGGLDQGQAGRGKSKGEQLDGTARTLELRWGQVWNGPEEAERMV